jgi:hypothetical protein
MDELGMDCCHSNALLGSEFLVGEMAGAGAWWSWVLWLWGYSWANGANFPWHPNYLSNLSEPQLASSEHINEQDLVEEMAGAADDFGLEVGYKADAYHRT